MNHLILILFAVIFCTVPAFSQMGIITTDDKLYALQKEGKFDEAIAEINSRIKLQPDKGELYLRRADFLRLQNKLDEAILDISKAIEIEPRNAAFYIARAEFFNLAKNDKAVLRDVQTALSLAPDKTGTLRRGAEQLFISKQYDENIKIADSYIARSYSTNELKLLAYKIRSENNFALKDYAGALDDAIKSIELTHFKGNLYDDMPAQFTVSDITRKILLPVTQKYLKDDKEIFSYYNRIFATSEEFLISLEQNSQRSISIRSRIDISKPEENSEKRRFYEQNIFVIDIENFRRMMIDCAELYAEKGQPEKGIELFEKAIKLKPVWRGYVFRSRFYKKLGKYREAIDDLNFAVFEELQCPNIPVDGSVWKCPGISLAPGDFYALTNQTDKAIAEYEKEKRLRKNEKLNEKTETTKPEPIENVNQPN